MGADNEAILVTKGNDGYEKVITKPLVKIAGCDYIVEGTIEIYKDGVWQTTLDYRDGRCDEWATKIWEGGSIIFSMAGDKSGKN